MSRDPLSRLQRHPSPKCPARRRGVNPSGGKLPIMPPLGRNGVDLYAQTKATGAWVWAGNAAGSSDEICAPLTAFTTDASSSGRADNSPLDSSVVARFILYLPLWRACSDDLAIGIPAPRSWVLGVWTFFPLLVGP